MPMKTVSAYNVNSPTDAKLRKSCDYKEITECPSCHYGIQPINLIGYYEKCRHVYGEAYHLYNLCHCPRCRSVFLSRYTGYASTPVSNLYFPAEDYSVPYSSPTNNFSDHIQALSPNFVETYNQSSAAESQQLFQICGVGYRKALEYLVKDYLCHVQPENVDKIRSEFLGASIKRIDNNRIKTLAERSTWIGNDETHYVRKHENLDIADMKRFIKATLTYIESELAFEEAEQIEPR